MKKMEQRECLIKTKTARKPFNLLNDSNSNCMSHTKHLIKGFRRKQPNRKE